MTNNCLVVGGAGYIGSHTCKSLTAAGYTPVVVDNLVNGHADAVKWGPLEVCDILDGPALDDVFQTYRPKLVLHFAAFAEVGQSVRDPAVYYRNNVLGSLSLLDAMRRHDVHNLVFSSTCATYGVPQVLPMAETTPQSPINPYGFTKLVIEHAMADYGRAYGLRWVALRYFNAAGCDPDGELGERHNPETHALPLAIQASLGSGREFSVFGLDYPTPDGSALRDYIHVCDLADAHVRAAAYLEAGGESTAFNLGTGRPTSVLELLAGVESATGRKVPHSVGPRRPGDPPALYADARKAQSVLGWQPRYTTIAEIAATAAAWFTREPQPVSG